MLDFVKCCQAVFFLYNAEASACLLALVQKRLTALARPGGAALPSCQGESRCCSVRLHIRRVPRRYSTCREVFSNPTRAARRASLARLSVSTADGMKPAVIWSSTSTASRSRRRRPARETGPVHSRSSRERVAEGINEARKARTWRNIGIWAFWAGSAKPFGFAGQPASQVTRAPAPNAATMASPISSRRRRMC